MGCWAYSIGDNRPENRRKSNSLPAVSALHLMTVLHLPLPDVIQLPAANVRAVETKPILQNFEMVVFQRDLV